MARVELIDPQGIKVSVDEARAAKLAVLGYKVPEKVEKPKKKGKSKE